MTAEKTIFKEMLLISGLGIGIALAIAFVLYLVKPAHGSAVCLTKSEARQLWPRRHIYWYSSDHCWSNRRGPPTGIKIDPIKNVHAESLPAATSDAGKGDRATVDAPQPKQRGMVRTIKILPDPTYDKLPKPKPQTAEWKNDFEDYCCWPSMEDIFDTDKERAFRILAERLRNQKK